jgi:LPS-assembly lipoprotein
MAVRRARTWLAAPLALAVAGCGFHLQGVSRLPNTLDRPYVDTLDRYTDFYQSLTEALDVSGSRPVHGSAEATAVVEVLRDESGQRVLSVSAENRPTDYEVFYTVEYRVRAGDRELLPNQRLTLTREYSFDERALLAKQQEQELLRAALARDLAGLVMRRLAALPPTPPPGGAPGATALAPGAAPSAPSPAATSAPPPPTAGAPPSP